MSKRKHARTAKTRTASKVRAKAPRRQTTNNHQTRANSKQARVLAYRPHRHEARSRAAPFLGRAGAARRSASLTWLSQRERSKQDRAVDPAVPCGCGTLALLPSRHSALDMTRPKSM